ncbi:serine hydrolase domain-containing protein [Chitinophaga sp. YIM B06452]|uniref:serine hydrolase domain-containing protein n=1 Tax=Chitinophaga sp. YIM B06452 TaxID=3082158 RepID=UPI0031FF469A
MLERIILLAILLIPASLKAQTTGEVNAYLQSAAAAGKFNGVALVAKDGKVILHKAYGWKDVAGKKYNDTSTRFPILSITKSFTAMVVLKLQEEGRLSLQDKLSRYFPDFPNGDNITLAQLLNHTSGLFNYTDIIEEKDSARVNYPVLKELIVDQIRKNPPEHAPGEDLSYNNSGYYLAGLIIEKVTGKPYEQNVRELIFTPLDMQHSGFDFNRLGKNIKATGYQFLNDSIQKPYTFLDSTVGFSAGAIYSTTGDMYKWTQAIGKRILSAASWDIAFTRQAGDYGIGFRVNGFRGNGYVRHSGGYPGFVSDFVHYPEKDVTIILFKNSGNYGEDLWPVAMGISSVVLGLPYDLWKRGKAVSLPGEVLKQRAGKYVADKLTILFTVKDGQLYEVLPDGTELLLLAESSDTFYLENYNTTLRFEAGKVTIHEHGADLVMKRVE